MAAAETKAEAAIVLPFFVYGTLLPGQPNAYLWQDLVMRQESARLMAARLFDMGHYPMCVPDEDGEVLGVVLWIQPQAYETVLSRLDFLEGVDPQQPETSAYRRVRQQVVVVEDGRSQDVWVYLGSARFVANKPVVPDGDWAAYAAQRRGDVRDWWTAVNTVAGLHDDG